ncbi:MAG: hypothetical protein AABZ39_17380 [Spirochaetota bacterium]
MKIAAIKKEKLCPLAVTMVLLLATAPLLPVDIAVSIDTNIGNVGDVFQYRVRLKSPNLADIIPPPADAIPDPFAVTGYRVITNAAKQSIYVSYSLSVYDLGIFTIPPLTVRAKDGSTAASVPVTITIVPLASTNGAPPQLPDIRGEVGIPFPLWFWLAIVGALLIMAFVVLLIIRIRRNRTPVKNAIPEDEEALAAIEALMAKKYIDAGKYKEFYFELSEVMRTYLSRRFSIAVLERTTAEIAEMLEHARVPMAERIIDFLSYADMIKFAKAIPSSVENGKFHSLCVDHIRSTRRTQPK